MSGWYIMHRGWMDSFRPEPFTDREAFLWSIEQAAIKGHDQWFNGRRIWVERGEFVTSIRQMADAFEWSIKRVRGFMERMGKAEKWAQRTAHDGAQSPTIITVCNYDKYQSASDAEGTVEGTVEGTQGAQSGHSKGTQQNKGNKGNKRKKEDSPSDSSNGEPSDRLPDADPGVPANDDTGVALDRYSAMRCELVPGAQAIKSSPQRRKAMMARLGDVGGLTGWDGVLAKIRGSPFLRGETSRDGKFVAEIDWLLKPANLTKVMEGNYDDRSAARSGTGRAHAGAMSTIDALRIARANAGLGGS